VLDEVPLTQVMQERPLSISQLRAFVRCPKSFELQYLYDPRIPQSAMGASVWFGTIIQRIIQRGYHEMPFYEAHLQVWKQACGPVFEQLQDWFQLDEEYRASGKANTNARRTWLMEHAQYRVLAEQIKAYQNEHLSRWNWSEKYPLTAYYRWSCNFARMTSPVQVLLPSVVLVEGLPVYGPNGNLIRRFDDTDAREHYRLLHGVIGGAHVVGVPDEFALDEQGRAWIADNKVSASHLTPEELAEDAQLAAYYELLRQNNWIAAGQPVSIGHIYIREHGVEQVWADTSRYDDQVLPLLHEQFARLKAAIAAGTFPRVRGIQPASLSPCRFCGVAHACPKPEGRIEASQAGTSLPTSTFEEERTYSW